MKIVKPDSKKERAVGEFRDQVQKALRDGFVIDEIEASREENDKILICAKTRDGSAVACVAIPDDGQSLRDVESEFLFLYEVTEAFAKNPKSERPGG